MNFLMMLSLMNSICYYWYQLSPEMIRGVVRHRSISGPQTLCVQKRISTTNTCTKSQHSIICDASVPLRYSDTILWIHTKCRAYAYCLTMMSLNFSKQAYLSKPTGQYYVTQYNFTGNKPSISAITTYVDASIIFVHLKKKSWPAVMRYRLSFLNENEMRNDTVELL